MHHIRTEACYCRFHSSCLLQVQRHRTATQIREDAETMVHWVEQEIEVRYLQTYQVT